MNRISKRDAQLSSSHAQYTAVASHFDNGPAITSTPALVPNLLADEVCARLRIGRTTLYKLVKSGELVPLRVTARIRVWPLSTIEAFLASKGAK